MKSDDNQDTTELLGVLIAKEEIRDVLYKYCRAVDRGDLELMKYCYHPDARDDHGFFVGRGWDFADYVMPLLSRLELSIHSLSNPMIEVKQCKAYAETHWSVIHRIKRNGILTDMWHQGRYLDEFERRNNHWKILSRVSVLDAERFIDTADFMRLNPKNKPNIPYTGQRGRGDPVYALHGIAALVREDTKLPDLWSLYRRLLWIPKRIVYFLSGLIQFSDK